ncbi:hypothetical protein PV04_03004 [Phialophora macrospora]|uniref:Uncharacterized protein n=1 Tax=Phialophora macrospora TaxID=1851006 RepID=A0A0D2FQY7_9EURO|nr:hypothetical protein PV04_03004 [Phialophora macrospora]
MDSNERDRTKRELARLELEQRQLAIDNRRLELEQRQWAIDNRRLGLEEQLAMFGCKVIDANNPVAIYLNIGNDEAKVRVEQHGQSRSARPNDGSVHPTVTEEITIDRQGWLYTGRHPGSEQPINHGAASGGEDRRNPQDLVTLRETSTLKLPAAVARHNHIPISGMSRNRRSATRSHNNGAGIETTSRSPRVPSSALNATQPATQKVRKRVLTDEEQRVGRSANSVREEPQKKRQCIQSGAGRKRQMEGGSLPDRSRVRFISSVFVPRRYAKAMVHPSASRRSRRSQVRGVVKKNVGSR